MAIEIVSSPITHGDFPSHQRGNPIHIPFNQHFPMVFLWFSYSFPMVFRAPSGPGLFFIAHGCKHQGPDVFTEVGRSDGLRTWDYPDVIHVKWMVNFNQF